MRIAMSQLHMLYHRADLRLHFGHCDCLQASYQSWHMAQPANMQIVDAELGEGFALGIDIKKRTVRFFEVSGAPIIAL